MKTGSVLLLDDDAELRDAVAELLTVVCGYECVSFGSFAELTAGEERALACDVALLDINLGAGQPSGLDAYEWLRARSFAGRIFFFTGHAGQHPRLCRAVVADGVRVLAKPVGVDELREAIAARAMPRCAAL
jgi:FixJ family two-component response regulator